VAQLDENIATLDLKLSPEELHEIDRWYTPCDVINDYNTARIPRVAR
jgi:diketogulonate reductase-like aldo/keto reductase